MRRTASDNVYLHKDFHGALSAGIEYLHQRYGEDAVREYLRRFTLAFHAPSPCSKPVCAPWKVRRRRWACRPTS